MEDNFEWFEDFDEVIDKSDNSQDLSSDIAGAVNDDEAPASSVGAQNHPVDSLATATRGPCYTIFDKSSLQCAQEVALEQVKGILGCSNTISRALLTYFSWNAEDVLSAIAERGEVEVYRRTGVLSRKTAEAISSIYNENPSICAVCFSEMGQLEDVAMSCCGHRFCRTCWHQHLTLGINEGQSRRLKCMAPQCGALCEEDLVKNALNGSLELLNKFEQALLGEQLLFSSLAKLLSFVRS